MVEVAWLADAIAAWSWLWFIVAFVVSVGIGVVLRRLNDDDRNG